VIVPETIGRLKTAPQTPLRLVDGAAALAAIGTAKPLATPAGYVFVAEEAAAENSRATGVLQRVEMDVSVVLVTQNVSDALGGAAAGDVEALKAWTKAQLLGWQPPSAEDVLTYVGGRMVRARDGLVWWELTFATATYLEA
jgi:hypothetical protein